MLARMTTSCVLLVWSASPAFAEVMDKEPTIGGLWGTALLLGLIGIGACAWNRWAGAAATLVAILFAWGVHSELSDPFVGRDILREAGPSYVRQSYMAILVCLSMHVAVWVYAFLRSTWRRVGASRE